MSEAIIRPIEIYKGEQFAESFSMRNPDGSAVNLTGMHFRAQFRKDRTPDAPLFFTFDSEDDTGTIVVDREGGDVSLVMEPVDSSAITYTSCVYDLFYKDSLGEPKPWFRGTVKVIQNSTRFD